jgi:hypothetical protein
MIDGSDVILTGNWEISVQDTNRYVTIKNKKFGKNH